MNQSQHGPKDFSLEGLNYSRISPKEERDLLFASLAPLGADMGQRFVERGSRRKKEYKSGLPPGTGR